jgi:hypothetical protein
MSGRDVTARTQGVAPNWIGWVLATTIGLSAGASVSTYLTAPVSAMLSPVLGGMPFVLLYGAAIGLVLAGAQHFAMRRAAVELRSWLMASALGAAVGYALAAVAGELLGNLISPTVSVVISEGTIEGVGGAIIGLAIGGAQWWCLRAVVPQRRRWMVASAIGGALGYSLAAAALELFEVPILKAHLVLSYGAIFGLFLGTAQAAVLRTPGREPTP